LAPLSLCAKALLFNSNPTSYGQHTHRDTHCIHVVVPWYAHSFIPDIVVVVSKAWVGMVVCTRT